MKTSSDRPILNDKMILNDSLILNDSFILNNENILYFDNSERQKFISKVYTTVFFQLLYTFSYIMICKNVPSILDFMKGGYGLGLMYISFNMLIIMICFLFCQYENILKSYPNNVIFCILFTLCLTHFLFYIFINIQNDILSFSFITTLFLVSSLMFYSSQTKINYTNKGNYLIIGVLSTILLGFFTFFLNLPFLNILYPILGITVFSGYLVYDIQLILGRETIKYTPDDYLIASVNLYLDIINLCMFVLHLINGR
jgi:protein lifeguard